MQRMYNAGYNIDALGECYGMTTASMCAFLAGDISKKLFYLRTEMF